jgi:hypothetical protein
MVWYFDFALGLNGHQELAARFRYGDILYFAKDFATIAITNPSKLRELNSAAMLIEFDSFRVCFAERIVLSFLFESRRISQRHPAFSERESHRRAVQAIVQSPRSLWDTTFTENSWITTSVLGGPIYILGRLQAKIASADPGMKIAITEYNNGGGQHIAGTIAEADNLGIFGA